MGGIERTVYISQRYFPYPLVAVPIQAGSSISQHPMLTPFFGGKTLKFGARVLIAVLIAATRPLTHVSVYLFSPDILILCFYL